MNIAMYWKRWRKNSSPSEQELQKEIEELRAASSIPTLWLFGKTGSGKSSIVRQLTGADEIIIGEGYRPQTTYSQRFEFPSDEEPLLRFLDTRGLGEAYYDPYEDIKAFSNSTQLVIVTVRVADHALDCVIEPLRAIRQQSPHRPVILALTCLHQSAAGVDISASPELDLCESRLSMQSSIPLELQTQISAKLALFSGLYDSAVAIDFTLPKDGFHEPNYGAHSLRSAILKLLPQAYRQSLLTWDRERQPIASLRQRQSRWQILASSSLAATASAVPLPWVNIPVVLAIQSRMAIKIAKIYEQEMTSKDWAALSSAAGTQLAIRLAAREVLKLIPIVGIAASAAGSFAFTYALGMACDWYFAIHRQGLIPSPEELKQVFAEQLTRGHKLWGTDQS